MISPSGHEFHELHDPHEQWVAILNTFNRNDTLIMYCYGIGGLLCKIACLRKKKVIGCVTGDVMSLRVRVYVSYDMDNNVLCIECKCAHVRYTCIWYDNVDRPYKLRQYHV